MLRLVYALVVLIDSGSPFLPVRLRPECNVPKVEPRLTRYLKSRTE